jgi:hypothetical protein
MEQGANARPYRAVLKSLIDVATRVVLGQLGKPPMAADFRLHHPPFPLKALTGVVSNEECP